MVRKAVSDAFDELGRHEYLIWLGQEHPRAFATLLAKCIPTAVEMPSGLPKVTYINMAKASPKDPDQWDSKRSSMKKGAIQPWDFRK